MSVGVHPMSDITCSTWLVWDLSLVCVYALHGLWSAEDRKLTPQECQCHLDNKFCLFCGTTGHVTKDCPKSSLASTKAQHPSLIRTRLCLPAWTWKKTEQSLRLHMTWGLQWTPSCKNPYSQCICSFKSYLTHSFLELWHPSRYGLKSLVDSRSSDSFIDSVFVQAQHLPAYGIPSIKLWLINGTLVLSSCRH